MMSTKHSTFDIFLPFINSHYHDHSTAMTPSPLTFHRFNKSCLACLHWGDDLIHDRLIVLASSRGAPLHHSPSLFIWICETPRAQSTAFLRFASRVGNLLAAAFKDPSQWRFACHGDFDHQVVEAFGFAHDPWLGICVRSAVHDLPMLSWKMEELQDDDLLNAHKVRADAHCALVGGSGVPFGWSWQSLLFTGHPERIDSSALFCFVLFCI